MSDAIVIHFGTVPEVELSANGRPGHWRVRWKKAKALRDFAYYASRDHAPATPFTGPVKIRATICWPNGRRRQDDTNVEHCLKSLVDGMTDAGYWVNDSQVEFIKPIYQVPWGTWRDRYDHDYPYGFVRFVVEGDAMT